MSFPERRESTFLAPGLGDQSWFMTIFLRPGVGLSNE